MNRISKILLICVITLALAFVGGCIHMSIQRRDLEKANAELNKRDSIFRARQRILLSEEQ